MKKIKIIAALLITVAFAFPKIAEAQSKRVSFPLVALNASGSIKNPDTSANTDTAYLMLGAENSPAVLENNDGSTNQFEDVVYEWSTVGLTGTNTGYTGTVIAQGSMTGVFARTGDWVTLISDVTQYNSSSTVSLVGGTNQFAYFILPKNIFKYVRLRFVFSGTGTTTPTGTANILPHG